MRYERCGVPANGHELPLTADTVFKRLRLAGYRVACTGKSDLRSHGGWKGLDGWTHELGALGFTEAVNQCGKWDAFNTGFPSPSDPYMARLHSEGAAEYFQADYIERLRWSDGKGDIPTFCSPLPRDLYIDDFAGQAALGVLQRWPIAAFDSPHDPWFLWVNFPGPHEPYDPPEELRSLYDGVRFPNPVGGMPNGSSKCNQDHQQIRRNYAAMITGIDQWVGRLHAEVERRGEIDNTIIIFSSDHGEMLGDHGRWNKCTYYEGAVHIPLILAGPGIDQGDICDDLIELIDVSASLLALAGLDVPEYWDARDFLGRSATPREFQASSLGQWRMIFDGRFKLVIDTSNQKPIALFDHACDPAELHNIVSTRPDVLAYLTHLDDSMSDGAATGVSPDFIPRAIP